MALRIMGIALQLACPCQDNVNSKRKEFADNSFKFHENGREFSKSVENTVGKGEIAHDEQFLLFLQSFQKTCIL